MKPIVTALSLIAVGMLMFELVMEPDAGERLGALVVFGTVGIGIAGTSLALPRIARRLSTLKITVVLLGVTAVLTIAVATMVAGRQMFITDHDLALFIVFMAFGMVAALAFGLNVAGPLTEDLSRIGDTSSAIAGGYLDARTGVSRSDEAGRLARDIDVMAGVLQELEDARVRAELSRRSFFAAIGHDLRTPLASMRAAIEAINDGLAADPEQYQRSLESDVEALSRLVDDVYLLARLDSGEVIGESEEVDLTEIADEALEIFGPIAATSGVTLRLDAGSRVLTRGSGDALARVMRNLIDNAVRYSPVGGEVVVYVWNGGDVWCRITDEGPGFSADFLDRAFERFSRDDTTRARSQGGGAGLGLAIAHAHVAALDGSIGADPGPGGSVWFSLPAADDPSEAGLTT